MSGYTLDGQRLMKDGEFLTEFPDGHEPTGLMATCQVVETEVNGRVAYYGAFEDGSLRFIGFPDEMPVKFPVFSRFSS